MALHRKQRGIVDGSPQYVRIHASRASNRAVSHLLQDTHSHAQRVYAKRYASGDRSRKISSLQLRACFLLCVLLYFGAIYFADDIASIGRVVGSEQNSQSFFVHSLRPRGRGNVRVGRAIDAKRVEETKALGKVGQGEDEQQHEQQKLELEIPSKELLEVEKHLLEAEVATAETEKAQATELPEQPELEIEALHQDGKNARDDAPGDVEHLDDQDVGIFAHIEDAIITDPGKEIPVARKTDLKSMSLVEINDGYDESKNALRHPEKTRDVDAVPAASPVHTKKQHIRGNVEDKPRHTPDRTRKPNERFRLGHGQHQQELESAKMMQPAFKPFQAKESVVNASEIFN